MKLKKLLILFLALLLVEIPFVPANAANGNTMMALEDFESYGNTLSSPWISQGARKVAELHDTMYGKSVVLSSTKTGMHELIRSFPKTDSNTKGYVLGFSLYLDDLSCNRHVLIRRDGSSDDIYMFKIATNGKMSVGSTSIDITLETGKWYEFILEHNLKSGYVRISAFDGETTQVGEATLAESAQNISGVYRMELVAFSANQDLSLAYVDNVYMFGLSFGPEPYAKPILPETFDDFVPAADGAVAPKGWSPRNLSANVRTATVEEFDDPDYGKALKLTNDGGRTIELLKEFSPSANTMTVEFDMMLPERNGANVYVRGKKADGNTTDATKMLQIDYMGNVYFSGERIVDQLFAQDEWNHFKFIFDYENKTYTASIKSENDEITCEKPFPSTIVSVTCVEFFMPASNGAGVLYVDNFSVYPPSKFGLSSAEPQFGKIGIDTQSFVLGFNSPVSENFLENGAEFSLNGNTDAITAELTDSKTITLTFASTLEYNTLYALEAKNIQNDDGEVVNMVTSFMTPPKYSVSNVTIVPEGEVVTFGADIISNHEDYTEALVIATITDENNIQKVAGAVASPISSDKTSLSLVLTTEYAGLRNATLYVWNSFEFMKPLANPKTQTIGEGEIELSYPDISKNLVDPIFDESSATLSVSGTNEAFANKTMTALVINPGYTVQDVLVDGVDSFNSIVAAVSQVNASSAGAYAFPKIGIEGKSGFYGVAVSDGNNAYYIPKAFKYISPYLEQELCSAFNDESKTADELAKLISDNADAIGFDEFLAISDDEQKEAISLSRRDCESIEEIIFELKLAILTNNINVASDDEIENLIFDRADSLGKNISVFGMTESFDSKAKDEFAKMVSDAKPFDSTGELLQTIGDSAVLVSMNNVSVYSQVQTVLSESEEWLGADFSKFFKLSNKKKASLEIMSKKYSDAESLIKAVDKAVKNASESSKESSGGGGGGGSSVGFAGPSSTASFDTVQPEPTNPRTPEIEEVTYNDLEGYAWAQTAINALSKSGVLNGVSQNMFDPAGNVTREQFAKMIILAFGYVDANATSDFADCTSSHWAYPYVSTAYSLGIINGTSSDIFGVGENITRQDMAVMLQRALTAYGKNLDIGAQTAFADESLVASYALDAVRTLSSAGIINGIDGNFAPTACATRAQAAKIIYESIGKAW